MKLKFYTTDGSSSEEKDFGIPEFEGDKGLQALKQYVLAHQANQRQGNASTKTRDQVRGGGKKPYRQKGTGSARAGSRRSPIWRGGGIIHGPQPRDYSQSLNKKIKRVAFQRAIFDRATAGEIDVIERFEMAETKTRLFNALLGKIAPEGKVLVVDDSFSDTTVLSARNIKRVEITEADTVNAYDLCYFDRIIISEKGIEKVLSRANGGGQS